MTERLLRDRPEAASSFATFCGNARRICWNQDEIEAAGCLPWWMDCRRTRELLSPLLDGELQFGMAKAVLGHLKSCAPCRLEADALRSLSIAVRAAGATEVPGGLAGRIVSEARSVRVAPNRPLLRTTWPRVAALLAGAAAVTLIATPFASREQPAFDAAAPLRLLVSDAHIDLDLDGSFASDLARLSRLPEGRLIAEMADIER